MHLSLRGLLVWGGAGVFAAYLIGAVAVLHYLKAGNSYSRVAYLDLVLPTRWQNLDRLRGEALIAQGEALLAENRFRDGFHLLRAGLSRHPAAHGTRLKIAKTYVRMRLRSHAEKLLLAGFDHGYPGREYLEFALSLAEEGERHEERIRLCELASARLTASDPAGRPAGDARWIDRQVVEALIATGRSEDAVALVQSRFPETDSFRRETVLNRLIEEKRGAEAVPEAARWVAENPRDAARLRLLVRACRVAGDFTGMEAALARLRALHPARPDALILAVTENHLAGRSAASDAALEDLLFRHGARTELYFRLATVFGDLNHDGGLDRIEAEATGRGLSRRPMLWARFQGFAVRHDWAKVLACGDAIGTAPGPAFSRAQDVYQEIVVRLARACLDPALGTQASLVEVVADHPGPLKLYTLLIDSLLEAGRLVTASRVLTLAEGAYADSGVIVASRSRIEAGLSVASAARIAQAEGDARLAEKDLPASINSAEAGEAELARLIAANDPAGALAFIAAVRRVRPVWFSAAERGLDRGELFLRARDDDPLRLQLLARATLSRGVETADSLLGLARGIHAEGHVENAILLTREVIRHDPGQPDALAQLATWQAGVGTAPSEVSP